MVVDKYVGFCTDCDFKVESFDGPSKCPNCSSTGILCSYDNQVTISINWQELRILCIWAERWAVKAIETQEGIDTSKGGRGTVYAIADRIMKQHEGRAKTTPLTMAGEFRQLKEQFPDMEVKGFSGEEH